MKRLLLACAVASLAAAVVWSVYSPVFIGFWGRHRDAQMVASHGGDPADFLIAFLLGLVGVDVTLSPIPFVAGAFVQWFLGVYLIGGAIFRERPAQGSPGGLRS
jgi:hypothetical protein